MEPDLRDHVAFYLTGKMSGSGLGSIEGLGFRPAMLARFRDLTTIRYDYPLVLIDDAADGAFAVSLSGLFDDMLSEVAQGVDAERMRHHAVRLECEIRKGLAAGAGRTLSTLWDQAEQSLVNGGDSLLEESLARLRASLRVDGHVFGCDRNLPAVLFTHAWRTVQEKKARRTRGLIDRLILKLSEILRADDANSADALTPEHLRACVGRGFADEFDFEALSRLLTTSKPMVALSDSRRARIQRLLSTLESQAFFPAPAASDRAETERTGYSFFFRSCADALDAYRERLPHMIETATAMAVAELEVDGSYREGVHDAMFEAFGADEFGPAELAQFPDYLVHIDTIAMTAAESVSLTEVLSADLPMKILVQIDDLVAPPLGTNGHGSPGARARQIAHAAIGIGGVFILQATSSHLYRLRDKILRGQAFDGPALFSIYSGAGSSTGDLPPYLASAAALESRAFPVFTFDPSAGPDWASRFSLEFNPQADRDWPAHDLVYEEESLQRASADVAFTLVDFLACDPRYDRFFARVPKEKWNGTMIPVADCVTKDHEGLPDKVPYVLLADTDNDLHRVIVVKKLIREARRCRDHWRSLQELGGIHNSHAERLVAQEREAWEKRAQSGTEVRTAEQATAGEISPVSGTAPAAAAPASAEPAERKRSDDPYIETPRCSSCNECIKINDRMFKYDRNKQAYIADIEAGTYAQLVQASESCQVAVIHPGKPRNPNETGLEELRKRAEPFV